MTRLIFLFWLLLCFSAHATGPEYYSSREWIAEKCHFDLKRATNQIFVGSLDTKKYFAVRLNAGVSVESLTTLAGFKGRDAAIVVLREKNPTEPVIPGGSLCKKNAAFRFRPGDVVWVYDSDEPW